ncbi:MAG: hypothetical protein DSZ28_01095 [Thiothrix sp.]|nr:MAG: hypothetical protein DSZ28_01095 [Thiothrix sp.]
MKKRYLIPLSLVILASQGSFAGSDTASNSAAPAPAIPPARQSIGWLGIMLGDIPAALSAQLNPLIPAGQGVLVQNVEPGSPADKAGIQANDVLLTYADQKLYSPAQLFSLVRVAVPGSSVEMQVVQQGQLKKLKVEIGGRDLPALSARPPFWQPYSPIPGPQANPDKKLAWDSFESVQVRTLPDGRYHAEVSYKDQNNESKSFSYEGKKEEIVGQIKKQTDIPEEKRQALLNALNMEPGKLLQPFNMPSFRDPFFQGSPFDAPFFQGLPQMPPFFQHYFQPPTGSKGLMPNAGEEFL